MNSLRKTLLAAATLAAASTAALAADGTWSTDVSGNWSDTTKWTSGTLADGIDAIGNFNTLDLTAARTVTIDTTSRTVGTLNFDDTGASGDVAWTLAASGGATLTLAKSSGSPVINTVTATTISSALLGTGGFTKNGGATLTLSGDNSALSGGFTISAGTLTAGHNNALGNTASTIAIAAGGTFGLNSGISLANTGAISMIASGNASSGRSGLTLTNTSSLSNNISLNYSGLTGAGNAFAFISSTGSSIANAAIVSGNVSFSGGSASSTAANNLFVLRALGGTGFGKVTGNIDLLTGNSTNTGILRIVDTNAVWELGGSANKWTTLDFNTNGAASQKVYVNSTGAIASTGVITNTNTSVNGSIVNTGVLNLNNLANTAGFSQTVAGLQDGAGNVNGASRVNVTSAQAATLTIGGSGTYTASGIISGSVALTMNGTGGTQTLSGANTYTGGTTITAGTLALSGSGKLGATTGALTINGGTLNLGGTSQSVGALTLDGGTITTSTAGTVTAGDTVTIGAAGVTVAANTTLALGANGVTLNTGAITTDGGAGLIVNSGTISGNGILNLGHNFDGFTGSTYKLISGGTISGTTFTVDGTSYDTNVWGNVSFDNTTGNLVFTAVPEPSTYGLIGAGALAAVSMVRRRRKQSGRAG